MVMESSNRTHPANITTESCREAVGTYRHGGALSRTHGCSHTLQYNDVCKLARCRHNHTHLVQY